MSGGCDYQGYEFGACYMDSICIDGFLWDGDSGDEPGTLDVGSDIPCPRCNHDDWLAHMEDDILNAGAVSQTTGIEITACPYPPNAGEEHKAGDFAIFRFWWLKGYADSVLASADPELVGEVVKAIEAQCAENRRLRTSIKEINRLETALTAAIDQRNSATADFTAHNAILRRCYDDLHDWSASYGENKTTSSLMAMIESTWDSGIPKRDPELCQENLHGATCIFVNRREGVATCIYCKRPKPTAADAGHGRD